MELIVFDLDGTLLDGDGAISLVTRDTLAQLSRQGVAYTVATGRTLHAARDLLAPHGFRLPQVFKNGVMIWDPESNELSHQNFLTLPEVEHVLTAVLAQSVSPFVFTLEPGNRHAVYHTDLHNDLEKRMAEDLSRRQDVEVLPAGRIPAAAEITNISALGAPEAIDRIEVLIHDEPGLVAYAGDAWEGEGWRWIDIHHSEASKGGAIDRLRDQLGVERVICFGDSDNDLSMFEVADESYAPESAAAHIKQAATATIGRHDQDGIAYFLRERFELDQ